MDYIFQYELYRKVVRKERKKEKKDIKKRDISKYIELSKNNATYQIHKKFQGKFIASKSYIRKVLKSFILES